MLLDSLAEIFAPMQVMIVLIIALLVFGPKRLPELGRQLGTALRDLNKAKNDFMQSFNTEYEPEPEPYRYSNPAETSYSYGAIEEAPVDLTDYTIVGQPIREPAVQTAANTVLRSEYDGVNGLESMANDPLLDYNIARSNSTIPAETAAATPASPETSAASEPQKEG